MIDNISMKPKVLGILLLTGLLPLSVIAYVCLEQASNELMVQAFNQLTAVREIKKARIESYLRETTEDAALLSQSMDVVQLFHRLVRYADLSGVSPREPFPVDTAEYRAIVEEQGEFFRRLVDTHGYYDVFVICAAHGHVLSTVSEESDLGANLSAGPLQSSGLAKLWRDVLSRGGTAFVDFAPYAPSGDQPAAFVGAPLVVNDSIVGVFALQLPHHEVNKIMQERSGMGTTGETYLVGPDQLMRSDSYLDPAGHSVEASFGGTIAVNGVDTEASRQALAGRTGYDVINDYNGNPVLSAYSPVDALGTPWAVLAEIDLAEIEEPIRALARTIFIIAATIAVLVTLIAYRFATRIARPVMEITRVARRISSGDVDQRVHYEARDEAGQLAASFRELIA